MKIHRLGTYATGFKYYKNKIEITNNDEIEKIKLLKIPPAYDNVTILNNAKIIAFGYDSKNRKQVLYNPKFIAKQNAKKYNKISASIKFFSKLKKKIAADLGGSNGSCDEKTLAIAVILTLIFTCGFRIGNKKYEKENNSVGLTTLKYKHLKFENNNKILIDFIGRKEFAISLLAIISKYMSISILSSRMSPLLPLKWRTIYLVMGWRIAK